MEIAKRLAEAEAKTASDAANAKAFADAPHSIHHHDPNNPMDLSGESEPFTQGNHNPYYNPNHNTN
jgi:hypothetical protein